MAADPNIYSQFLPRPTQPMDPFEARAKVQSLIAGDQAIRQGQYAEALQQRQLRGMSLYGQALKQFTDANGNVDDQSVAKTLTANGYPDFATAHLEAATKTRDLWVQAQKAAAVGDALRRAAQAGELSSIDDVVNTAYSSRLAQLAKAKRDMPADTSAQVADMTQNPDATEPVFDPSDLPQTFADYVTPEGGAKLDAALQKAGATPEQAGQIRQIFDQVSDLGDTQYKLARERLANRGIDVSDLADGWHPNYGAEVQAKLIARANQLAEALNPQEYRKSEAEIAAKGSETTKNLAEAAASRGAALKSAAEAANLQEFGAPLTGKEAAAVRAVSNQLFNKPFGQLMPEQQVRVLGEATAATADPDTRAALLAQKNLAMQLQQMQLDQQPTAEDAALDADMLTKHLLAPSQFLSSMSTRGVQGLHFKQMVLKAARTTNPDFDWEQAEAEYQLVKNPNFQQTIRYMNYVTASADNIVKNARILANGGVRDWNALLNAGKKAFNNVDLRTFETDRLEYSDAVAKILQGGGTGNGTSDAKLAQANSLLKDTDDPAVVEAVVGEIGSLIGKRRHTLAYGTYLDTDNASPYGGAANTSPRQGGPVPDPEMFPDDVRKAFDRGQVITLPSFPGHSLWKKGPDGKPVPVG